MNLLHVLAGAVSRTDEETEAALNSVGFEVFIPAVILALAVSLLLFSMVRRLRRGRYRAEAQQVIAAELDEREGEAPEGDASEGDDPEAGDADRAEG